MGRNPNAGWIAIGEGMQAFAVMIFNPLSLVCIAIICVGVFGVLSDADVEIEKEKTKQVAMQLEIARLNAGITNKVEVTND